jgi:prepilin-type N-terminal cleavage/methylation domain-containing protein
VRRASGSRGFTLVELTVALLAGLIVAMAIVSLAKESTQTFHEEARSAAAEAALRTAVDRLGADLARAGYMSTGNVLADTNIAKPIGAATPPIPPGMVGLRRLASIHLYEGGSGANGLALSSAQSPALAPDAIDIGGNMTSAEEFEVQIVMPTNGNCQRILISATSPAIYRVAPVGDTQPAQDLRNVFQPVPAGMSTQFVVRVVDDTGRSQFVLTCPEATAAGFDPSTGLPYVDVDAVNTPILTAQQTGTLGGISGYASGRAWVNPVHVVRWEITTAALEAQNQAQYANAMGNLPSGGVDPNKYDLVRSYVDMATGQTIPATTELVAEYAVDLDFAFSVDNSLLGAGLPNVVTFAFEDDINNDTWAQDVSLQAPPFTTGPQRIRSVRARVATRSAIGDRTVNVPVNNYGNQQYLYRYCINTTPSCNAADGTLRWARARTITTEVALPNQARNFF